MKDNRVSFERLTNTQFVRRLLNDERLPANSIKGKKEKVFIHKNLIS